MGEEQPRGECLFRGGAKESRFPYIFSKKNFFLSKQHLFKKKFGNSCSDISPALFVRGGWSMRKKSRGENPPWQIYSNEGRVGLKKLAMGEGGLVV